MDNQEMLSLVRAQLATDLNCSPDDFSREGILFCEAGENPGRRPFPREARYFDMVTMGRGVVVSATADILPYLREQLNGKGRDDAFSLPFIHGQGLYYLPDLERLRPLPAPDGVTVAVVERPDIEKLYVHEGFSYAVHYVTDHPRPDVLVTLATVDGVVAGMAGASADCDTMWQIGIDVLPAYRGRGIAAALTNTLTRGILERGKVPYYAAATSNVASQRVAHRAGLRPAWTCIWRGLFDGVLTAPTS